MFFQFFLFLPLMVFKLSWIRTCDLFPFKFPFRKYYYFKLLQSDQLVTRLAPSPENTNTVRRGHVSMSRVEFAHEIQFIKQSKSVRTSEAPFLNLYLLLQWRYSPGWALASFTIRLQASRSLALSLHSFIPIFLRSVDTSSSHFIFGLPLRLVTYSFPYNIFLGIAVSCIFSIRPSHFDFIYFTDYPVLAHPQITLPLEKKIAKERYNL